jgi:RNA polymerase sigma-70 factor (ECF subfamily)
MTTDDRPTRPSRVPVSVAADRFEAERARLLGIAYRILGSRLDAEDVVQDAWLRYERADPATVERPEAWLTTVVSRLALDQLRSARSRREAYVGPWLPEFVRRDAAVPTELDPQAAAELSESLTVGFLRVLEALGPVERVVFLLADVFDVPHAQIADIVGRSPGATRQIASRARRRVHEQHPGPDTRAAHPRGSDAAVVAAMVEALAGGEVDQVVRLLRDDAVLISDGGANARAARRPVVGADRIARFLVNLSNRGIKLLDTELTTINCRPGVVLSWFGVTFAAIVFEVDDGQITAIAMLRNPDKLAALDLEAPLR